MCHRMIELSVDDIRMRDIPTTEKKRREEEEGKSINK